MTAMSHRCHVTSSLDSNPVLCCQLQLPADDRFANLTHILVTSSQVRYVLLPGCQIATKFTYAVFALHLAASLFSFALHLAASPISIVGP